MEKIHIAPMMGWTDQHFRYFMRLLHPHVALYSEMITTGALIHGDAHKYLHRDVDDGSVVLQLGGCDPQQLAHCAQLAQQYGYTGVNLNVGCPSDRVQAGRIGACLYKEPALVAECVMAMKAAVSIPVSVKCRIGVDDVEGIDRLIAFLELMHKSGCASVQVHARKAWLKGLNPKQNRSVPPLDYELVYAAAQAVADLPIILNGGLLAADDIQYQLSRFPGVMIGRAAYKQPMLIRHCAMHCYPDCQFATIDQVLSKYMAYVVQAQQQGRRLQPLLKPLYNVFFATKKAKLWRKALMAYAAKDIPVKDLLKVGVCD